MQHIFYSDGNKEKISWAIKTDDKIVEQTRKHADIYLDKITDLQSKYIALHVGIFWCIGVFIIKNEDTVKIILDNKEMFDHLKSNIHNPDKFIENRTFFIKQLINQRNLKIKFELIDSKNNIAKKLLCKGA